MSFDEPGCFFREEQIWNNVFDKEKQVIRVQVKNKSIPTIKRIEVPSKDSEESFIFPQGMTAFSIKDRGNSRMRYAYKSGEVENNNGEFLEFGPYGFYKEEGLNRNASLDPLTLYFSSSKDNRIIEIIYWL